MAEKLTAAEQAYFDKEGYTLGPIPTDLQQFYGNDPRVLGYKIADLGKGVKEISAIIPQEDGDGVQFITYGGKVEGSATSGYSPFVPTGTIYRNRW
jgi:hypothetical protein